MVRRVKRRYAEKVLSVRASWDPSLSLSPFSLASLPLPCARARVPLLPQPPIPAHDRPPPRRRGSMTPSSLPPTPFAGAGE